MRDMITDQTIKKPYSAHFYLLLKCHFAVCKLQDIALIKRKIWNGIHNIFYYAIFSTEAQYWVRDGGILLMQNIIFIFFVFQ